METGPHGLRNTVVGILCVLDRNKVGSVSLAIVRASIYWLPFYICLILFILLFAMNNVYVSFPIPLIPQSNIIPPEDSVTLSLFRLFRHACNDDRLSLAMSLRYVPRLSLEVRGHYAAAAARLFPVTVRLNHCSRVTSFYR